MRSVILSVLLLSCLAACKDFPGADGRYATHDRGALNRGPANRGLPVTPYEPR